MKKFVSLAVISLVLIGSFGWATCSEAVTLYVSSTTGSDRNTGLKPARPLATIGAAIAKSVGGDSIHVAKGTYSENLVVRNLSITLSGGWNTDFVTSPTTGRSDLMGVGSGSGILFQDCGSCYLYNFTISNYVNGIEITNATQPQGVPMHIESNTISGNSGYGILLDGCYADIWHNVIANNANYNVAGLGNYSSRANLVGNYIAGSSWGGVYVLTSQAWRIINNIIVENNGNGVDLSYYTVGKVYNNTIVGNGGAGIQSVYGASTEAINNIVAFNRGYGLAQGSWLTSNYNDVFGNIPANYSGATPGLNDFSADPLLDATYHLTAGTPCKNAGQNLWTVPIDDDFDGDARVARLGGDDLFDVGADEMFNQAAALVSTNPADYATRVKVTVTISFTFSEPIAAGPDWSSIQLLANGTAIPTNNYIVGNVLYIDPLSDLAANTTFTATVPSKATVDLEGKAPLYGFGLTFTTGRR